MEIPLWRQTTKRSLSQDLSEAENQGQKKPKVKRQNKNKKRLAHLKDEVHAAKANQTVKRYGRHGSNTTNSQDHVWSNQGQLQIVYPNFYTPTCLKAEYREQMQVGILNRRKTPSHPIMILLLPVVLLCAEFNIFLMKFTHDIGSKKARLVWRLTKAA